ncbi:hypothetical protein B0J11DRAFT_525191 [Dendryphion nanum]|uniref:Uncharacterized protein n=1 Tax=Dendryphion nanum TaxID=256645 RepID=A0A9P9DY31_9PLEO|nr:hypothetical protein B0J11DRAFT_525191 [Dendryphion nanum]
MIQHLLDLNIYPFFSVSKSMSVLVALASVPGLMGTQEAIRQGQQKERREEHRARRCNFIASCIKSSVRAREINGRPLIIRDGGIYIDTCTVDGTSLGHQVAGYYLPYPESPYEGLVTTITDAAPYMNWIFVDSNTSQVRYGVRKDAQPNFTGPFDCTRQDRRLTFQGWEGFCAVEVKEGVWSLFFDVDDDGLRTKVAPGTRVLEIELKRVEKRWKKEIQTRHLDQTTNRVRELDSQHRERVQDPSAPKMSNTGKIDAEKHKTSTILQGAKAERPSSMHGIVGNQSQKLDNFQISSENIRITPRTPDLKIQIQEPFDSHPAQRSPSSPPAKHSLVACSPTLPHPSIRQPNSPTTIIRVQPPVILSTYQHLTPRRKKGSQSYSHTPQIDRHTSTSGFDPHRLYSNTQNDLATQSTTSTEDYRTLINLTPPTFLGDLAFHRTEEWDSMKEITESRARKILRRLGEGSKRRKKSRRKRGRQSDRMGDRLELERKKDRERSAREFGERTRKEESRHLLNKASMRGEMERGRIRNQDSTKKADKRKNVHTTKQSSPPHEGPVISWVRRSLSAARPDPARWYLCRT